MPDASETGTGFGDDFCKCVIGISHKPDGRLSLPSAGPAVYTFQTECHRTLASTKSYRLVTEGGYVIMKRPGVESIGDAVESRLLYCRAKHHTAAPRNETKPCCIHKEAHKSRTRNQTASMLLQWQCCSGLSQAELVMGHFFKTQPNPKFLDPTQPNPQKSSPDPTQPIINTWYGILGYTKNFIQQLLHVTDKFYKSTVNESYYSAAVLINRQ